MDTAPQPFCENCGARLTAGIRFCEACGRPVAEAAPAVPPAVSRDAAARAPSRRLVAGLAGIAALLVIAVVAVVALRSPRERAAAPTVQPAAAGGETAVPASDQVVAPQVVTAPSAAPSPVIPGAVPSAVVQPTAAPQVNTDRASGRHANQHTAPCDTIGNLHIFKPYTGSTTRCIVANRGVKIVIQSCHDSERLLVYGRKPQSLGRNADRFRAAGGRGRVVEL